MGIDGNSFWMVVRILGPRPNSPLVPDPQLYTRFPSLVAKMLNSQPAVQKPHCVAMGSCRVVFSSGFGSLLKDPIFLPVESGCSPHWPDELRPAA